MTMNKLNIWRNTLWNGKKKKTFKSKSSKKDLTMMNDQFSKPLSKSNPSMAASGETLLLGKPIKTASWSPSTYSSNTRQKKFHRHFCQVSPDERVINYYSCALVGDILLQGHLYITFNYFAFYSNVFGYITRLLIPTNSVVKISKEKTARIIPNAVAVVTDDARHVFGSLLSRDSTYKLMMEVWQAATELKNTEEVAKPISLPLPIQRNCELNAEEDDSSVSENGGEFVSRSEDNVCINPLINDESTIAGVFPKSETGIQTQSKDMVVEPGKINPVVGSIFCHGFKLTTIMAILIGVLTILYVSAALMMIRIDRLHNAYLNHPFVTPERLTQDHLLHYLNTNLEQIVKVRQSLQVISEQFIILNKGTENDDTVKSDIPLS